MVSLKLHIKCDALVQYVLLHLVCSTEAMARKRPDGIMMKLTLLLSQ